MVQKYNGPRLSQLKDFSVISLFVLFHLQAFGGALGDTISGGPGQDLLFGDFGLFDAEIEFLPYQVSVLELRLCCVGLHVPVCLASTGCCIAWNSSVDQPSRRPLVPPLTHAFFRLCSIIRAL